MNKTCRHPTCSGPCRRQKKAKVRSRIRPVSKRQGELLRRYSALRMWFLKDCPPCPVTGRKATEVHHKAGRGRNLLNVETWLGVTREGHVWIETHPEEAKRLGYSISRLK